MSGYEIHSDLISKKNCRVCYNLYSNWCYLKNRIINENAQSSNVTNDKNLQRRIKDISYQEANKCKYRMNIRDMLSREQIRLIILIACNVLATIIVLKIF